MRPMTDQPLPPGWSYPIQAEALKATVAAVSGEARVVMAGHAGTRPLTHPHRIDFLIGRYLLVAPGVEVRTWGHPDEQIPADREQLAGETLARLDAWMRRRLALGHEHEGDEQFLGSWIREPSGRWIPDVVLSMRR